jgi:Ca-activated chloride channel family protein
MSFRRALWTVAAILLAGVLIAQPQLNTRGIVFSVTDKNKQPVLDLKDNEVTVIDNGKAQSATSLARADKLPIIFTIVLDTSGSTVNTPLYWQEELNKQLGTLVRPVTDKAMVIRFDSRTYLTQEPTDDLAKLGAAIMQNSGRGGTALYDSLILAAREMNSANARKVILLISDGEDTASANPKETARRAILESNVTLFAFVPKKSGPSSLFASSNFGQALLEELATASGGRSIPTTSPKDFRKGLDEIAAMLRSQYGVVYQPSDVSAPGAFRKLKVEIKRKDTKVMHPAGYFVKP